MKKVQLETMVIDGMYMDIHSIEFAVTENFKKSVEKCRQILMENPFLTSVAMSSYGNDIGIHTTEMYNSSVEDAEKSTDCDSRIDIEIYSVHGHGVYYRGYSKWTSDFLEVDLSKLV